VKPNPLPSKFISYFQLLEAFQKPGCPVCALVEQGALRALDGLMYEQVNDPITRDRLVESHGFCNWHAWMLLRIHNSALGVAIIYRHLLLEALGALGSAGGRPVSRGLWRRLGRGAATPEGDPAPILTWRRRKARCYLCNFAAWSEREDLRSILQYLGEPEFGEAFARSAGLCLPHLCQAAEIGQGHANLGRLLSIHETHWRDLLWELEEFGRKFDYRYRDEDKGREGSSWRRALELFVGQPGLFGPERGREMAAERGITMPPEAPASNEGSPEVPAEDNARLRFENEKLRWRVDQLLGEREADRAARRALEFQVVKLTADLKAMRAGVGSDQPPPHVSGDGPEPSSSVAHEQTVAGGDRATTD